jgi:hypothetical protein
LFEGDTAATLAGRENVYCIVLQNDDASILDKVRAALSENADFKKVCGTPLFATGLACTSEPLPEAGRIDDTGALVGGASNAQPALYVVTEQRDRKRQEQAPQRTTAASKRTCDLPAMSDFGELREFVNKTFTVHDAAFASGYWMTPEELCDLVEQYASLVKIQYKDKYACARSADLCCVRLFPANVTAPSSVTNEELQKKEYLEFVGLFPFRSEKEVTTFLARDPQYAETLRTLAGIQGTYQLNFGTGSESPAFNSYSVLPATLLWRLLWVRRRGLIEAAQREEEVAQQRAREQKQREGVEAQQRAREQEQRKREEEEKAERDARQKAENARKQAVMQERAAKKACTLCGRPLGFFNKLTGRITHRGCRSFHAD